MEKMRIKFKQAIKGTNKLPFRWHYWGYIEEYPHDFVSPIGKVEWDNRPSYQFTGLKDKNGKEIYNGNKIQDSTGDIGTVYWKENVAGFYCKWGDGSDMPLNCGVAVDKCEVIGNIHENSDLLEKNNA